MAKEEEEEGKAENGISMLLSGNSLRLPRRAPPLSSPSRKNAPSTERLGILPPSSAITTSPSLSPSSFGPIPSPSMTGGDETMSALFTSSDASVYVGWGEGGRESGEEDGEKALWNVPMLDEDMLGALFNL
jgi:hypothetical protein